MAASLYDPTGPRRFAASSSGPDGDGAPSVASYSVAYFVKWAARNCVRAQSVARPMPSMSALVPAAAASR